MRLFKLGAARHADQSVAPEAPSSLKDSRRDELLGRICELFSDYELEVTADNLLIAHAAFSGKSPRLARRMAQAQTREQGITQAWMDTALAEEQAAQNREEPLRESAAAMLKKLDSGLSAFADAARSARSATGDYQSALESHASSLNDVTPDTTTATNAMIASLADLTRTMIERTQAMEEDMRKSEEEAASLRTSLEHAQREAQVDHLTGLPNRRAFEGVLQREYRDAQQEIDPLCVAFCDIDHFKLINDTHGHETGDRVIQAIAQVLSRISNDRCHVARHGGEEFVLLFRGITTREAHQLLDDVREQLAARTFVNRKTDEPIGGITFSGGIADVFAYADPRAALEAADDALYRAKAAGRNQICLAE